MIACGGGGHASVADGGRVDASAPAADGGSDAGTLVDAGTTPSAGVGGVATPSAGRGSDAGASAAAGSEAGASGAAGIDASGAVYPQPGQRSGPGVLPPKVGSVTYKDTLIYDNSQIVRDLGFSGV
ncbi:MAG TPA: hypothetical protein VHZ95_16725, partial [Polyangiales bacterium]|nr:hypothetical protein [Polyangiales bacterium]